MQAGEGGFKGLLAPVGHQVAGAFKDVLGRDGVRSTVHSYLHLGDAIRNHGEYRAVNIGSPQCHSREAEMKTAECVYATTVTHVFLFVCFLCLTPFLTEEFYLVNQK